MADSSSHEVFIADSDGEDSSGKAIESESDREQRFSYVPWGRNVEELPGTMKAYAAAKDLQSELRDDQRRRSFIKVLSKSSSRGNLLPFPIDFAKKYMPLGESSVTLVDGTGESWAVKWSWKPGRAHPGLYAKWKSFVSHHGLSRGDVVLILLRIPATLKFNVHVFKRKMYGPSVSKRKRRDKVSKPRTFTAAENTSITCIKDSEEESSDTEQMPEEEDKAKKISVSVDSEKLWVELVLQPSKVKLIKRMLLGSGNSVRRSTRGGRLNAIVGEEELEKLFKLVSTPDFETS